jgi:hypothetical protein
MFFKKVVIFFVVFTLKIQSSNLVESALYDDTSFPTDALIEECELRYFEQYQLKQLPLYKKSGISFFDFIKTRLIGFDPKQDVLLVDFDETAFLQTKEIARCKEFISLINDYMNQACCYIFSAGINFIHHARNIGLNQYSITEDYINWLSGIKLYHNYMQIHRPIDFEFKNFSMMNHFHLELNSNTYFFPEWMAFFSSWIHLGEGNPEIVQIKRRSLPAIIKLIHFLRWGKKIRNIYFIDDQEAFIESMVQSTDLMKKNGYITGRIIGIHVPC